METIVPVIDRIRDAFGNMPRQIESLKAANGSLASHNSSLTSTNEYLERQVKHYERQLAAFEAFADEVDPPTPVVDEAEDVKVDADQPEDVDVAESVDEYETEGDVPEPEPDDYEPMAPEQDDGAY